MFICYLRNCVPCTPQPNDYANDFVPGSAFFSVRWIQANIIIITIGNSVIKETRTDFTMYELVWVRFFRRL